MKRIISITFIILFLGFSYQDKTNCSFKDVFNSNNWKADSLGCQNLRKNEIKVIAKYEKQELIGMNKDTFLRYFGKPDYLVRADSFEAYTYFLENTYLCDEEYIDSTIMSGALSNYANFGAIFIYDSLNRMMAIKP